MLVAVGKQESGFNQAAVSPAGAIGMFQLMPETAKALGIDPHDATQNIVGGAAYLRDQYKRFGSWPLALAAYNAGPGAVEKAGNEIPDIPETKQYVRSIMAMIQGFQ